MEQALTWLLFGGYLEFLGPSNWQRRLRLEMLFAVV